VEFVDRFGSPRPRQFFAPGRVNLMGAHLDYNGGPVMPLAIDRGTFIALRPRADRRVRFASTIAPEAFEADLDHLPTARCGSWADYPLGVLREVLASSDGADVAGLDILFGGNLAVGAGLSSSASICVGTALALSEVWDLDLGTMARVRAALRAEREFVGVRCGIMDPFAIGLAREGSLLWLDCKDESTAHLPLDSGRVSLVVADSGVRRELAAGFFNRRVDECRRAFEILRPGQPDATCLRDILPETLEALRSELGGELERRASHVVGEVARTFEARDALLDGRLGEFGERMSRAHESLRDLFEVSCPELDCLVETAVAQDGVLGGRLTGAGFGGCAVILVRRGAEADAMARVGEVFRARFGRETAVEVYGADSGPREIEP
jgi:galactokinase